MASGPSFNSLPVRRPLTQLQACMPLASSHSGAEMYQKVPLPSVFAPTPRPLSRASDSYETEFEDEDMSDFEEYAGRTSEDSFGNGSNTTASTLDELRTPASNTFGDFNFQLPREEKTAPTKSVEGPVGPHLFRRSSASSHAQDIYIQWSPVSPEEHRAGPKHISYAKSPSVDDRLSRGSVSFHNWTPHQVAEWMRSTDMPEDMVEKFRINDISGRILKDLQFGDLKELGITSFGQRHLLWNEIRTLRGGLSVPSTPADGSCSPCAAGIAVTPQQPTCERRVNECSNPSSPDDGLTKSPGGGRRRARRALRPDDVISPGESASIVAIEQLLPKPHHCSKGKNCSKWQKQQRKLAKIMKEFPGEFEQIVEASASPNEFTVRPISEAVPSVVASSDLLGAGRLPALRINEEALKVVETRDPQENVRHFLSFQHLDEPVDEPTTPPYEMFPPLSPPRNTQAPHGNLGMLPKLKIPASQPQDAFSPNSRTAIQQHRSPITAMRDRSCQDIYRLGSPASAMDVPVTAIPLGPIARDESQSVPPDMRFGEDPIQRCTSQATHRQPWEPWSPLDRPKTSNALGRASSVQRSVSRSSNRRQPTFAMAPVEETHLSQIDDDKTPTSTGVSHAGWMKKRKTKMLRHEWHEQHCRLNGTTLAMHRDSKAIEALEYIDVDEYAVACSTLASNKLNSAFRSLKINSKKDKRDDVSAFSFQLVPAAEKKGILNAAIGKTHHFAVKARDERIDWMRELMLAKALRQKADGCEVNLNGKKI